MACLFREYFIIDHRSQSSDPFEPELFLLSQDKWLVRIDPAETKTFVTLVSRRDSSQAPIEAISFNEVSVFPITFEVGVEKEVQYDENLRTVIAYALKDRSSDGRFKYVPRCFFLNLGNPKEFYYRDSESRIKFHLKIKYRGDLINRPGISKEIFLKASGFHSPVFPAIMEVHIWDFKHCIFITVPLEWDDAPSKIYETLENNVLILFFDLKRQPHPDCKENEKEKDEDEKSDGEDTKQKAKHFKGLGTRVITLRNQQI